MSSRPPETGPHVGAMLRLAWQGVWKQIFAGVVAAGYEDVNPAHVSLFRFPGLDGQRPSEVADQVQITKQSVNDLLRHLEARGYLTRAPDPDDGRARIVRLTAEGRKLQETVHGQARLAEQRIAEVLGADRYADLRHALTDLTRLDGFRASPGPER